MQTPKPRPGSLNVPQKQSLATTRTARKLKTHGSDSDSSPNPISKTPKDRSAKVADRRSPRVLAVEKKRSNKVSELDSQIIHLQEELKKAKQQLSSNESWKSAQQEAEDAKKQLAVVTAELEETKKELKELSECEDTRVQELRKISQDRDRAWQSELEAVQKQHELDSAALASAINEMRKLKLQLDRAYQSEASQARHAESAHAEIQSLRLELTETLVLVEKLKTQLSDSRVSEARSNDEVTRVHMQLEILKAAGKTLQEERVNAVEAYNTLRLELEHYKNRVKSLQELISILQANRDDHNKTLILPMAEGKIGVKTDESEHLKTQISSMKNEVSELRGALEAAERRYQDEQIQSTLKIGKSYELIEHAKLESSYKAAELEKQLKESRDEVEELRTTLIEKEKELQSMSCKNNGLNLEHELDAYLKKSLSELEDLKAHLLSTKLQLQTVIEENKILKSEIKMSEKERSKANEEAHALAEAARAAEHEASIKLGSLTEEANQSFRKAALATEQLDAAQAANFDMEAELRRLKVQCDQWRKAAEAATAMLSTDDHGRYIDKTGSFDYHSNDTKLSYSQSEDTDDEDSPKKRNGNMLKRIGVLWKKGQK
ncbi:interactor of constitutive active ROPs 2, chloroplastic-like [Andrographis paniculata]|uniref:interactor of constitutive active ROPs 2, chloroplastic-like n=1 Tax=Andrographis paniculata TaxID=175694 RepID=UPI0021E966FA|nr:interactor of constitutive active ROPs 2, chloroplastic-like [Andrographis paniculata]XP_051132295.1 interactor of constitutive active ROPs 2, chloroplastic-like [Andrographis paniculata]XP_051132296.1 interactor of constitutive active ROPs 2, chloroplastic-like [Andrographis paniculata]XP_051132297.1 interactor of constitutive active ROPs 2, chloroplastic-like [Andrographis paniculata]